MFNLEFFSYKLCFLDFRLKVVNPGKKSVGFLPGEKEVIKIIDTNLYINVSVCIHF